MAAKKQNGKKAEQKTTAQLAARAEYLEGKFIDKKCPLCGATLLGNEAGDEWCSNVQCHHGLIIGAGETSPPLLTQRDTTTIQVKVETKAKLEILKEMLNQPDYNSTLTRIIDLVPQQLSSEAVVVLKMPVSRYRWLMAHQDSCDCRQALNDAKV